jgi:hypothetical protein
MVTPLSKSITRQISLYLLLGVPEKIMLVVAYVIKGKFFNKMRALTMNRSGILKQVF